MTYTVVVVVVLFLVLWCGVAWQVAWQVAWRAIAMINVGSLLTHSGVAWHGPVERVLCPPR